TSQHLSDASITGDCPSRNLAHKFVHLLVEAFVTHGAILTVLGGKGTHGLARSKTTVGSSLCSTVSVRNINLSRRPIRFAISGDTPPSPATARSRSVRSCS